MDCRRENVKCSKGVRRFTIHCRASQQLVSCPVISQKKTIKSQKTREHQGLRSCRNEGLDHTHQTKILTKVLTKVKWIEKQCLKTVVMVTYLSLLTNYRLAKCVAMFYAVYLFLFSSFCPFLYYLKNNSGGILLASSLPF